MTEALFARVQALEEGHAALKKSVDENTLLTQSVKTDTADLVEFTRAMKGFATFCRWIGRGMQWLAPIALVIVSVWAVLKDKKL